MIRAIIFDCFGVLYRGSLEHLYELTPIENHEKLRDLSHGSDFGYVSAAEYMQQVGELTNKTAEDIERIISSEHVRSEPMLELVRSLRGTYKTALLSNVGNGVIERLFSPKELEELFDTVVMSSVAGMVKPHPEIFELTATRLGVTPEECIMIDDLEDNCFGASQAGMTAIQHRTYTTTQEKLESLLMEPVPHA